MATINGRDGAVTVGTNSPLTFTNLTPTTWSVTEDNAPLAMGGLGDDFNFHSVAIPGWTASIDYLYRRATGAKSNVADAGVNAALKPTAWTMNFALPMTELTGLNDSVRTFDTAQGVVVTGTFTVLPDDTEAKAAVAAAAASVIADAVFTLTDTANDNITADIHLTNSGTTLSYSGEAAIQYTFAVSDAPTFGSASPLTGFSAVQTAASTVTGTLATGRTMAGGAYLSGVSISSTYNQAISIGTTWQGTGALTIA